MKIYAYILRLLNVSMLTMSLMLSGVSGMVLCFGADGHVALEPSHNGSCSTAENEPIHNAHGIAHVTEDDHADCTDNCVDVPIPQTIAVKATNKSGSNHITHSLLNMCSPVADSPCRYTDCHTVCFLKSNIIRGNSHASFAQRTIILRI